MTSASAQPQVVTGELSYLDPGSTVLRRFTAPGASVNTGAYAGHFPDGPGYRRALITSLWRVFSPPPQDWPLAICDYTSVGPEEGLDNRMAGPAQRVPRPRRPGGPPPAQHRVPHHRLLRVTRAAR
jgi:hypothetical protein